MTMFITSSASTFSAISQPTSLFPISFHLIQVLPFCVLFSHLKWSEWLWLSEFRWRNLSTLLSEGGEKLSSMNINDHIVEKEVIICNPYSKATVEPLFSITPFVLLNLSAIGGQTIWLELPKFYSLSTGTQK